MVSEEKIPIGSWVLFILIFGIPLLSLLKFHIDSVDSSKCKQHILFTPSIYSNNTLINDGFTLCNEDNSFWSMNT